MSEVTQILSRLDSGDASASAELLPLVYEELRKLASAKLANEKPGQTLQATALVHEAYLRLVGIEPTQRWDGCGHFFAAAAEAMRRILIDRARRNRRLKHGGSHKRVNLDDAMKPTDGQDDEMIAVNDLLDELACQDPVTAEVVKLRYFAGFTLEEVANLLQISASTVKRRWSFARAWLYSRIPPDRTVTTLK
jgi:RNA polymerase sigma factor (TIGR02999 family)